MGYGRNTVIRNVITNTPIPRLAGGFMGIADAAGCLTQILLGLTTSWWSGCFLPGNCCVSFPGDFLCVLKHSTACIHILGINSSLCASLN